MRPCANLLGSLLNAKQFAFHVLLSAVQGVHFPFQSFYPSLKELYDGLGRPLVLCRHLNFAVANGSKQFLKTAHCNVDVFLTDFLQKAHLGLIFRDLSLVPFASF